jgi:hypothetical protein
MSSRRLTPLQESEARRIAAEEARKNKVPGVYSDKEKATRKERVAKAKDALARSSGAKGDHVKPARASLKAYLQQLNQPKQPDDARFESLLEAPFKEPPKKRNNNRF